MPLSNTPSRDYDFVMATPWGALGVVIEAGAITCTDFLYSGEPERPPTTDMGESARAAIQAYLADPQFPLNFALRESGTNFQRRVWQTLRNIPAGETRTYGQIAAHLKSSPRAVGGACRANPIPIFTPCHRVVAAGGVGGFSGARDGAPLAVKQWLLAHERKH